MARVVNVGAEGLSRGEFKLIPTGTKIKVALYEVEETVTGQNAKVGPGKPQIVYTAKVTEEGEFKGRELKYNYVPIHGLGADTWKLAAFAEAMGWAVSEDGAIEVPETHELSSYLGTEFVARVGQQTSQKINPETGAPYVNNTISGVMPLSGYKPKTGGGGAPATPEKDPWS